MKTEPQTHWSRPWAKVLWGVIVDDPLAEKRMVFIIGEGPPGEVLAHTYDYTTGEFSKGPYFVPLRGILQQWTERPPWAIAQTTEYHQVMP